MVLGCRQHQMGSCEHGKYILYLYPQTFLNKNLLGCHSRSHQISPFSQELLVPPAFLGTHTDTWSLCTIPVFLLRLLQGRPAGACSQLGSLNLGLFYPLKMLWWWSLHQNADGFWRTTGWGKKIKGLMRLAQCHMSGGGYQREREREGGRERGRGFIWAARRAEKPKLSQKFLAEPPPSFTDFVSQQQWAAGLTLWVVQSLGWAVSLAGWTEGIAG